MDPSAIITALAPFVPVAEELGKLVYSVITAGGDTEATARRLRALVPTVAAAAQSGASTDTDAEWAERVRRGFGGPTAVAAAGVSARETADDPYPDPSEDV